MPGGSIYGSPSVVLGRLNRMILDIYHIKMEHINALPLSCFGDDDSWYICDLLKLFYSSPKKR